MTPLISIVIPAYNIEAYISDTLDSVFAQTYTDIEVIAVDDGSTDKTGLLLDGYAEKEPRLRVIHKQNGGVTKARLDGIRAAKGEYIGFVDGDDLIDVDMYERLYNNAIKYSADISHCGYRVATKDGIRYLYNTGKTVIQTREQGITDLLQGAFIEPGLCNKIYRAALFDTLFASNKLDSSIVINEDLLMNFYLFSLSNKSIYEDFCPYNYIKREGSASQSDARYIDYAQPVEVREIILNACKGTQFEELAYTIYISKMLHYLIKVPINSLFSSFNKELIRKVKLNRRHLHLLNFKQKIIAIMVIYTPRLFTLVKNKILDRRGYL